MSFHILHKDRKKEVNPLSYMHLSNLGLEKTAIVQKVHLRGNLRRRLLDLGFSPGVAVTPLFRSPLGDPTAYQILGSIIALRKEETDQIEVTPLIKEDS